MKGKFKRAGQFSVVKTLTDEKVLEIIVDFATALESACVNLKRYVVDLKDLKDKPSFDPSKIKWKEAQGARGLYERSEDVNSLEFKAMLKDLVSHSGKMQRNGYFYWTFQNGSTVGRKKRK